MKGQYDAAAHGTLAATDLIAFSVDEDAMREGNKPDVHSADDGDDSFDEVRVEPIAPGERAQRGEKKSVPAPDWTQRISTRGKLARALIAALAVTVAVIVVLPRTNFTLPPQITRLLTPAPTQTPTPGRFTTGAFEQVPLPNVPNARTPAVIPSPHDPSTAYACMNPVQTSPIGDPTSGEISLWITHDAGQTWSRAPLPETTGVSCGVEPAMDGSHRMALSVSNLALDQNGRACAHAHFYLSEDDGATWRTIEHTSVAPPVSQYGDCVLQVTTKHLYLETFFSNNGDYGHTMLERSDDDGQTWQRADHSLENVGIQWYAQPLDSSGESLVALINRFDNPGQAQTDLWITRDAGATWRHIGPVAPDTLPTNYGIGFLLTEVGKGVTSDICHCAFGLADSPGGSPIDGQHLYRTTDFIHWTPLPPIPVKGTSAQRSGVYQTLGMTADGRLLALGADPQDGVSALLEHDGRVYGPPPALWAWNSHSGRWDIAATRVPCKDLQTCYMYSTGAAVAIGANGKPAGTSLWINQVQIDENEQPAQGYYREAYYRIFIPAA
ncbi:MAG TPA: sialidase family protein [Ktedonobacterales bacterium]